MFLEKPVQPACMHNKAAKCIRSTQEPLPRHLFLIGSCAMVGSNVSAFPCRDVGSDNAILYIFYLNGSVFNEGAVPLARSELSHEMPSTVNRLTQQSFAIGE